jgi:hypothetical protein
MRIVIPDPESLSPSHPIHTVRAVEVERNSVKSDPLAWASARRSEVQHALDGDSERAPIVPRQAGPGNISMHDHLVALRSRYDSEPETVAGEHVSRLRLWADSGRAAIQPALVWGTH